MATATKRKGQGQDKAAAKKKKCECGRAQPTFGMPGDAPKDARWCSVCPDRHERAVDVKNKKCECGKARPSFGMPGDAPKDARWCSVCPDRHERAVDVKNKKCECGKAQPHFGMPGDAPKDARWCSVCPDRHERAVDVRNKKCECGKARPNFGMPGEAPKDARWCSVCPGRGERAVDVVTVVKRCKACEVRVVWGTTLELREEDFCKLCYEERYPPPERAPRPRRGPIKEQAVQMYLARRLPKLGGERLCGWRFNQQVPHSRTCRRKLDAYYLKGACIDAVPGMKGTAINVEVQENQHASYDSEDEEQRCFDIIEAVEETLGRGYATFLARINPDSYTDSDGVFRESPWSRQCEAVVSHKEWGRRLVVLERCLRSVEKQLGLVELFHDGYNAEDWGEISDEDAIKASRDSGVMEMSEWRSMYN